MFSNKKKLEYNIDISKKRGVYFTLNFIIKCINILTITPIYQDPLKICNPLSVFENNYMVHILESYLDLFIDISIYKNILEIL